MSQLKWGLVSTIKAPPAEVLRFVAFHLQAGAHRIYIYLDAPNPLAYDALKAHPKCRVTLCDAPYWAKHGNRPQKHQVRQTVNATHAYHRRAEVDWLIHMDVDEFLVSERNISAHLAKLPTESKTARIRPMEALSGDGTAFKAFIPNGPGRAALVRDLYPTFGTYLKGGFLSHLAGKVFVRTGLNDIRLQIHNAFQNDLALPGVDQLDGIDLAHCHAKTWEDWHAAYHYRLEQGSYRAELAPNRPRDKGGLSLHELFALIESEDGTKGLRAFFDEVCADTPSLRARLKAHGLLRKVDLDLTHALATHFPDLTL
jgi:hypothetical protein